MIMTALHVFINELRIMRHDASPFVILFIMPSLALILLTPALGAIAREYGQASVTDSALSVPAMTVMFGSLGAAFVSFSIVRERDWACWSRLLTSAHSTVGIIGGKLLPPMGLVIIQQVLLVIIGAAVYGGLGELQAGAYIVGASFFAITITAFGLVVADMFSSLQKMNAVIHIGALLFASTSGAFIPIESLPFYVKYLLYISPGYWLVVYQKNALLGTLTLPTASISLSILSLQAFVFLAYARARLNCINT